MGRKLDVTTAELEAATWQSAKDSSSRGGSSSTGRGHTSGSGSGHSGGGDADTSNRVEVAAVSGGVAMRASNSPQGPVLLFTPAEWEAFVAGASAGEFDVPIS